MLWLEFLNSLLLSCDGQNRSKDRSISEQAQVLTQIIQDAAGVAIPRVPITKGPKSWWTPELQRERSRVRALGVQSRTLTKGTYIREQYERAMRAYSDTIRKFRDASWHEAVMNTRQDPYNWVYKLLMSKLKTLTEIPALKIPRELNVAPTGLPSVQQNIEILLETLFPADIKDTESQSKVRAKTLAYEGPDEEWTITEAEVRQELRLLPNRKAPGYDGVTYELLKQGGPDLEEALLITYNRMVKDCVFRKQRKNGTVSVFLKNLEKDPMEVRRYGPIGRLPFFRSWAN